MFKVAVAGCGAISAAHIPVWEAAEDCELVAVCDILQERLRLYPDKRSYLDFDEMIAREELDIIDICLPTDIHVEYSIKAMEKGIHVLCEKPVSLKKEAVTRVYESARKNGVNFMIAQVLRFWPEYEFIKELNDSDKYGNVISGYMCRLGAMPRPDHWMADESRSGSIVYDLHVHDLDFMVYCFGLPAGIDSRRICRSGQDCMQAIYEYPGFFVNAESAGYVAPLGFTARYRFQFERALVVYENNQCTIYEAEGGKKDISFDNSEGTTPGNVIKTNAYANEILYFVDCIKKVSSPER